MRRGMVLEVGVDWRIDETEEFDAAVAADEEDGERARYVYVAGMTGGGSGGRVLGGSARRGCL